MTAGGAAWKTLVVGLALYAERGTNVCGLFTWDIIADGPTGVTDF